LVLFLLFSRAYVLSNPIELKPEAFLRAVVVDTAKESFEPLTNSKDDGWGIVIAAVAQIKSHLVLNPAGSTPVGMDELSIQSGIRLIVLRIVKSVISTLDIIKNVLNEAGEFIGTGKKDFDAQWIHVLRYMNGEIRVSRASPLPYFNTPASNSHLQTNVQARPNYDRTTALLESTP
jgi:hypothetical protein